jgi:hypothetical protein
VPDHIGSWSSNNQVSNHTEWSFVSSSGGRLLRRHDAASTTASVRRQATGAFLLRLE